MRHMIVIAVVVALLVPGTALMAQDKGPGNDAVWASLYAGGFFPVADLGNGEFDSSATIGGTLGWWVTRNIGVRGNFAYAQTDVSMQSPSDLVGEDPDIFLWNADVLVRFPVRVGATWLSPYVLGGIGGKTYDFQTLSTETEFAGNFGAGADLRLGFDHRWGLFTELRAFVSELDHVAVNDTQWDIAWTGGISLHF